MLDTRERKNAPPMYWKYISSHCNTALRRYGLALHVAPSFNCIYCLSGMRVAYDPWYL
ncbi:hypothetical protein HYDPIDRAFT_106229, partial [Hydnomerulius pinastri MD-312]